MTVPTERKLAEERLLDAALEQVFAGEAAMRWPPAQAPARTPLLAAAIALFGIAVLSALMWQARGVGAASAFAQDPAPPSPLPPELRATAANEIAALPASTQNLVVRLISPDDVVLVTRLQELRRLQLAPASLKEVVTHAFAAEDSQRPHSTWDAATADFLAPLATLPKLEALELPGGLTVLPAQLTALKSAPKLRALKFVQLAAVDDALVAALAELPHLRELQLDLVHLDAATMKRLRKLPLEEIELSRCLDFDAAAFAELCEMKTLRAIAFGDLGRLDYYTATANHRAPVASWKPGPADLQRLSGLTALKRIALHNCAFTGDDLAALPGGLVELELTGTDLVADDYRTLSRFGLLRRLNLSTLSYRTGPNWGDPDARATAKAKAFAAALGSLRLAQLQFSGALTPALQEQLAQQIDLTELHVTCDHLPPIGDLAKAPRLATLELVERVGPSAMTIDDLHALASCRSLRRFDLTHFDAPIEPDDVAKVLGPQVAVTVRTFALPTKK